MWMIWPFMFLAFAVAGISKTTIRFFAFLYLELSIFIGIQPNLKKLDFQLTILRVPMKVQVSGPRFWGPRLPQIVQNAFQYTVEWDFPKQRPRKYKLAASPPCVPGNVIMWYRKSIPQKVVQGGLRRILLGHFLGPDGGPDFVNKFQKLCGNLISKGSLFLWRNLDFQFFVQKCWDDLGTISGILLGSL